MIPGADVLCIVRNSAHDVAPDPRYHLLSFHLSLDALPNPTRISLESPITMHVRHPRRLVSGSLSLHLALAQQQQPCLMLMHSNLLRGLL